MKKLFTKFMALLASLTLLLGAAGMAAFASPAKTMNLTLRVEGYDKNLFNKTETVPYTDALTVQAALQYIDGQEDGLSLTGVDKAYITAINGETAGKFGGWDGWLYNVNGTAPTVGINDSKLKDGDSLVLYYGNFDIQCPTADTSKLADGVIKFTSADTTYDADYNPTVTVNPVVGAKITWSYGSKTADYTTDKNGEIKIDAAQLTAGAHGIQITKMNEAGLPLALRFAPGYTVTVAPHETTTAATTTTTTAVTTSTNPGTGDRGNTAALVLILPLAAAALALTLVKKRQSSYEE